MGREIIEPENRIEYSDYRTTPPEHVILDLEDVGNGKYEWRRYYKESDGAVWRGPDELDADDKREIKKRTGIDFDILAILISPLEKCLE
jgi:hypothetical protein